MSAGQYDAIVIGGGHNGLVTAAYLARAGKKVIVFEKRHVLGGAAVTEEINPGFKYTVCSYVVSLLRPEIIRDLNLPKHGLRILPLETTFTPLPNDDYLMRWGDHDQTRREIFRHSPPDADAYDDFGRLMHQLALAVKPMLGMMPPDPTSMSPGDLLDFLKLGRHFRDLGHDHFHALYQLMTMSSADFLEQWFETESLIATMASSGIIGTFLGPRSPGTAYVLLHHYMGEVDGSMRSWGFAKGGTGGVSAAIASAAREHGAEIRTEAGVSQVMVRNGRAVGVALDNGDEYHAPVVVSALDPKRTFLKLVEEKELPNEFVKEIKRFRIRGSSGKVNLSLSELPDFTCWPGVGPLHQGSISISPNIDYLEQAYDEAKYGDFSSRPYMDIILPSMFDPDMAPPGKHVMSIFVQYAPSDLRGGWDEHKREAFGDAVVDTLSQYAPNLPAAILHRQVLTPWDIERDMGLTSGNIFHGELLLNQLFCMRPTIGWADYTTPLRNYYQAGSGTHPGGGVTGATGRLAALKILKGGN
jgi:phytoene dehydrogenase-like protein